MKMKAYQYASEISVGRKRPILIDNQLMLLNIYIPKCSQQNKIKKKMNNDIIIPIYIFNCCDPFYKLKTGMFT